jgi:hypothetical protein
MSGAAESAKKILQVTSLPMAAPIVAAKDLITKGENPLRSVGRQVGTAAGTIMESGLNPLAEGAGLVSDQALPNIAADDPAATAEAAKKEKARTKRQAEIDLLTDRPGRGGTILTDQYVYKV